MGAKQIQGGLHMLKQLSGPQTIFGSIILLFAWSLFTEQASDDVPTSRIALLFNHDRDGLPLFKLIYQFM